MQLSSVVLQIRHLSNKKNHTKPVSKPVVKPFAKPLAKPSIQSNTQNGIYHGPMGCASMRAYESLETHKPYHPHVEHEHGPKKHNRIQFNNALHHHSGFNDLGSIPHVYFPYLIKK